MYDSITLLFGCLLYSLTYYNVLLKILPRENPMGKKKYLVKEKRVQYVLTPPHECITLSL